VPWALLFSSITSWERGLNENTNGLIKQFFTKGGSFDGVTDKMVSSVKFLLNRRPRKTLECATPQEEFFKKSFGVHCALQG
jgi:IS30 family transposase